MTVLEGPTTRLRPVEPRDQSVIFSWYNDPEIVAPYDRFAVETFDEFARSVQEAPADPASLAPRFVIERRTEGDVIGVVGYYRAHPVLEYVDVWYVVGHPAARGRGHGREAVGLLVDHVFRRETVERVGATCDVENGPSYRLLEALGFQRDGTMRSALFHHSRWHDVFVYGVTRGSWKARVRSA